MGICKTVKSGLGAWYHAPGLGAGIRVPCANERNTMRLTTPPEFQSEAMLRGIDFAPLDLLLRQEALEHGLEVHDGHGRSTWCETELGEFGVKKRGGDVLVFARAHRPEWLSAIQEAIVEHLAETMPETAQGLRWSSLADIGKPPANFSLARVGKVRRLSADFLRMRLHGPDLGRLATLDSIHFRLVLPVAGDTAPEWPRLGGNGQVQWPSGAKALHRPVYTVRAIDADAGWLETDIFLHHGGRISDWALAGPEGDLVGLMGPSGGGIPTTERLLLAGDQTAWPAIARILESRPDAMGTAWLLGAESDYPMPKTGNISVTPLPDGAEALATILQESPPESTEHLWMAGEKSRIAMLRHLLLDKLGHDKRHAHLAAYWTAGTPDTGA